MANVADVLGAEIIDVPGCPGYSILLGGDPRWHGYVRDLARTATIRASHPWVTAEQTDAAMLSAIKSYWTVAKPGWVRGSSDETIVELHAHSAIEHHLPHGCVLLSTDTAAALRALSARPDLAERQITAYRGYSDIAGSHQVLWLVLEPGSSLVSTRRVLDIDAYNDQDIERYDSVAVRGRSVVEAIAADGIRAIEVAS